jgi:hypothetical protein
MERSLGEVQNGAVMVQHWLHPRVRPYEEGQQRHH